jgi:hypothetical protein
MTDELKITISFDKERFRDTLTEWALERKCKTCEFEEQKTWEDTRMPVCNICQPEVLYWRINEGLFDKLLEACITVVNDGEMLK